MRHLGDDKGIPATRGHAVCRRRTCVPHPDCAASRLAIPPVEFRVDAGFNPAFLFSRPQRDARWRVAHALPAVILIHGCGNVDAWVVAASPPSVSMHLPAAVSPDQCWGDSLATMIDARCHCSLGIRGLIPIDRRHGSLESAGRAAVSSRNERFRKLSDPAKVSVAADVRLDRPCNLRHRDESDRRPCVEVKAGASCGMFTAHSEIRRIGGRHRCFPANRKVPQPAFCTNMFLPRA
jgi:hypothetical protein